jgi:hypothetical protein
MELEKGAAPAGTVVRAPQGTLTNRFYLHNMEFNIFYINFVENNV